MDFLTRFRESLKRHFRSQRALRGWSIALLIANCGIVVTGALVRITGSGLGCPTWPRCTHQSFLPEGVHGVKEFIEFGNRTLTFVLIVVAVCMVAAVHQFRDDNGHRRPGMRTWAWLVLLGMPLQAVVGGISVRTNLNPYVVGLHLFLSVALIAMSVQLLRRAHGWRAMVLPLWISWLGRIQWLAMWIVVICGIVVTGSGPHAGDINSPRTGLDFLTVARVHAAAVWVLCAIVVVCLLAHRAAEVWALFAAICVQGALGYLQIIATNTGQAIIPMQFLVIAHLLGVSVVAALSTNVMLTMRPPTEVAARGEVQNTNGSTAMATNTSDK